MTAHSGTSFVNNNAFVVEVLAPTRVDLIGGTIDLWPIHHLLERSATINVAVNLPARCRIQASEHGFRLASVDQNAAVKGSYEQMVANTELPLLGKVLGAFWRPDDGYVSVETEALSPAGAGLGGSSAMAVAMGRALNMYRSKRRGDPSLMVSERQLVATVQDVEASLIKAPTGCQDYWAAVRGGVNVLRFPFGGVMVTTRPVAQCQGLMDEMILCFSGKSRASAINNWQVFKAAFDGDENMLLQLRRIGELSHRAVLALEHKDWAEVLRLSEDEWRVREKLWPTITTSETRAIDQAARAAGAQFSRVCGAGGGGMMVVMAKKTVHKAVREAIQKAGGTVMAAAPTDDGAFTQKAGI